jgi:hypothetical protein
LRLFKDKKGQVRVIEAFFASVLILSCLTLIPTSVQSQDNNGSLAAQAQNVLCSLNNDGYLAMLVDNHDWLGLKESIEAALPLTLWFNLTVYDSNMQSLNDYPISNTGAISDQIASVNYLCASQNSTYAIYTLRLQLSGVD